MGLRLYVEDQNCDHSPQALKHAEQPSPVSESHYLGQYIPLHYHHNMLQDEDRVRAFRDAIELRVKPGMSVLELGGGTGILSFLAAQQGAKVICVERNPELVQCAKHLLKQNGKDDLVTVVADDARQFVPQEPVDVVICEMLHVALLREKQLEVIEAFKSNYTQKFPQSMPQFLPEASILMVQPVEQSFEFSGYWAPVPLFHAPTQQNERTLELGPLTPYASVIYDESFPTQFVWQGQLTIQKSGTLSALRFITQNAIAIDVQCQRAINWPNQCLVLPVEKPREVVAGQILQVAFQYHGGDPLEKLSQSIQVSLAELTKKNEKHQPSSNDLFDSCQEAA